MSCLSFWVPPPGGRLHPSVIKMLGASELPLRQGFRLWRKRLYGANAPPRCAGPHGRCPQTVHPVHKNDHTFRCGHFYGYRRKLNCSGGINPPCAKVWAFSPKRLWGTPHRKGGKAATGWAGAGLQFGLGGGLERAIKRVRLHQMDIIRTRAFSKAALLQKCGCGVKIKARGSRYASALTLGLIFVIEFFFRRVSIWNEVIYVWRE